MRKPSLRSMESSSRADSPLPAFAHRGIASHQPCAVTEVAHETAIRAKMSTKERMAAAQRERERGRIRDREVWVGDGRE